MAIQLALAGLLLCASSALGAQLVHPGEARRRSLLQTWGSTLDGTGASGSQKDTPVTRVVKLLKEMGKTIEKEQEDDEAQHKKQMCACNSNTYEKNNAIEKSTAKIADLKGTIEELNARTTELKLNIKELDSGVVSDKQALAEANAIRDKEGKEFHGGETDSIQAVEQLKAAIAVLSKHETAPDSTVAGGAIFKSDKDKWESFLETNQQAFPWNDHREDVLSKSLGDFMSKNGFDTPAEDLAPRKQKFLQQATQQKSETWSAADTLVVKAAIKTASAFVQAHHGDQYMPAYNAQSGEILGVLRQLKEEMESDLSESQQTEANSANTFADLRSAKTAEIDNGERMAEQKEDQFADGSNKLAEAKEDHEQEQAMLDENQQFMTNLKVTCADAEKNFDLRKSSRLEETQAVAQALNILTEDDARDAMSGTYNFLQMGAKSRDGRRSIAAEALRRQARKSNDPQLSILATSVELDAFSKVTKAIDDMIAMLAQLQKDEVKKNDWCKAELHENEMVTAKTTDHRADLEASINSITSDIQELTDGLSDAHKQVAQVQLDLQRASEDRKAENTEFQRTVADQSVTVEVLKKALDKLAKYYDFVQTRAQGGQSPSPEAKAAGYAPSRGASGVMEMIEKLVHEAKDLIAKSKNGEQQSQAAYEQLVEDSNASVHGLQQDIVNKNKSKNKATKDKLQAESDHSDTVKELEGYGKYNGDLHADCDYMLKNFDMRQGARGEEMEALNQAKQILKGAALS